MPGADNVALVVEGQARVALEREGEGGFVLKDGRNLRFTATNWLSIGRVPSSYSMIRINIMASTLNMKICIRQSRCITIWGRSLSP